MIKNQSDDVLQWMMRWYQGYCDGDWEHQNGIHISTLDNPGWSIDISLLETEYCDKTFPNFLKERTENDWIAIEIKSGVFKAGGGPRNLKDLIELFRAFTENRMDDYLREWEKREPLTES